MIGCAEPAANQDARKSPAPKKYQMLLDEQTITRLRPVLGDSATLLETPDTIGTYVATRWAHLEQQGPNAYQPLRANFVETPWAPEPENFYVALYPTTAVENLLDFKLLVSYTSSIQQDLIAHGKIDLQYFYPENVETIISGMSEGLSNAEILSDHDSILKRINECNLPPDATWITDLKYDSAIIWGRGDHIEVNAATDEGYLLLFSIDG